MQRRPNANGFLTRDTGRSAPISARSSWPLFFTRQSWFTNVPPCYRRSKRMTRPLSVIFLAIAAAAGVLRDPGAEAQSGPALNGVWALDRSLSEFPREMGFNVDWIASP